MAASAASALGGARFCCDWSSIERGPHLHAHMYAQMLHIQMYMHSVQQRKDTNHSVSAYNEYER